MNSFVVAFVFASSLTSGFAPEGDPETGASDPSGSEIGPSEAPEVVLPEEGGDVDDPEGSESTPGSDPDADPDDEPPSTAAPDPVTVEPPPAPVEADPVEVATPPAGSEAKPEPGPGPTEAVEPVALEPIPWFLEVGPQLSRMDRSVGLNLGGRAGVSLFERLIIGAEGYGLLYHGRDYPASDGTGRARLSMGFGGAMLGASLANDARLRATFQTMLGGGQVCQRRIASPRDCIDRQSMFVAQLELDVYVQFAPIARAGLAVGYRFFAGLDDWDGPGNFDLGGGYGTFMLSFGQFGT